MLDDDFFELDEDLLNATDFSKKLDETGKQCTSSLPCSLMETMHMCTITNILFR